MEYDRIGYTRSKLFHKPKVYKEFIKGNYYGFDEFIEKELGLAYLYENKILVGLQVIDNHKWFLAKIKYEI